MKSLIDLYKRFGISVGIVSDAQGFMSTLLPGSDTPKPWTINSKRAVLPLPEQLQQHDWSKRIGFHPLLQSVVGGESPVLEKFRDRMNGYADYTLGMLLIDLAQLSVKKEMHKELSVAQSSYLGPFSDADEKFVKLLVDLVATNRVTKKNAEFVRFSLIKGRVWQGVKRARVAVMHFPLYEALPKDNKPTVILGHKLRINDVKMLRAMYEFLFMGLREQNFYEVGSDSKIAPSMESLMAVYAMFTESINKAVAILEPVINTSNALYIVDDWRDDLQDLEAYLPEIRKIPLLEGNAPSERVQAAAQPQMISELSPAGAPVRVTATAESAPVISVADTQQIQHQQVQQLQPIQGAQTVQTQPADQPRFKLGAAAPTVTAATATHQLPDNVTSAGVNVNNTSAQTIGYARPSATPLAPTPPVGQLLQTQQAAQPQQQFLNPQQQFAGNVLGTQPMMGTQPMNAAPQAMKIPESARMVNGILYIPLEAQGVAALPQGALIIDNRPYVPLANVGAPGAVAPAMGAFAPAQAGRFGMPGQAITDPAQIPGLSEQEINYYRSNPVMFQNYLQQLQINNVNMAAAQMVQRQTAVPRYLQNAVTAAQQAQQQATGFFGYRR